MQLKANELIDQCLAAIGNSDLEKDVSWAWIETLDALDRNLDFTAAQFAKVKTLLRQDLPPSSRTVLTRILVLRTEGADLAEFLRPYLAALSSAPPNSTAGEVLRAFNTRHKHAAPDIWGACAEVLGRDEAVRLLAGIAVTELPDDVADLLNEEVRTVSRSCVLWDFVMAATPAAWKHLGARRPDNRQKYWHALLDWPYDGSGRNSSHLVTEGITTEREAQTLEWFGARLRSHLSHYDSTPSHATLVADANLEELGNEALERFFECDFKKGLRAIYRSS